MLNAVDDVVVWKKISFMNETAAWEILVFMIEKMKTESNAVVYVIRWDVKGDGCWNALWSAKMKIDENISNAEMYVGSNEMLIVDCCCWSDEGCIDNIEISEIIEKNNTNLNICCEIAVENANSIDADVDSDANVDSNADVDLNADLIDADAGDDWNCWIDDDSICCTDGIWNCCINWNENFRTNDCCCIENTDGIFRYDVTNEINKYSLPCRENDLGFFLPCRFFAVSAVSAVSARFFSVFKKFLIVENVNFSA